MDSQSEEIILTANKVMDNLLNSGARNSVLIRVSPEFKEWLESQRARLEKKHNKKFSIVYTTKILLNDIKIIEQSSKQPKLNLF